MLLDLDLQDGTTVERNVEVIRAAGPAVLVLAAADKPLSVRAAMRAGALGYVLKSEETVKQYVGRVREKYARADRAAPTKLELYHRAVEDGYLPPPPPP